jgi:hypothetical protein
LVNVTVLVNFNLRKTLATLPPTLDETYDRILCDISEDDYKYAVCILRWLAFSSRPLSVEEISEAVAIDIERNPMFDPQEVLEDPLDVLDICSSLITITTTTTDIYDVTLEFLNLGYRPTENLVGLAHYSVKEYLISERRHQSRAEKYYMQDDSCNEFLATSCLGYLLRFEMSDSFPYVDVEESKLARYAAEFWITHTQAVGERGAALNHQIMVFFSKRNSAYLSWAKMYDPESPSLEPDFTRTLEDVPTPLYFASLFGWTDIVERLLSTGADADVNTQGGTFSNALQAASHEGHEKVVEQLLNAGANVNGQGGRFFTTGSPLQAASYKGHEKVVERLLSAGVDVNAQGAFYRSALWVASCEGHEEIAEQLLNAGADVNGPGVGFCSSPLETALCEGHEKVVERLRSAGAFVL